MKRYVRADAKDDFREYLQQFKGDDLTDQDIENMVYDAFRPEAKHEVLLTPELEDKIYREFSPEDADEICALIECGYSVDAAIQSVID